MKKLYIVLIIISLLTPVTSYAQVDNYARDEIRRIERKIDKLTEKLGDNEWLVIDKQGTHSSYYVLENINGERKIIGNRGSANSNRKIIVGDKVIIKILPNTWHTLEVEYIERVK